MLFAANGLSNTAHEENDYSALMDSIDGPQLAVFLPAMAVKLPPNISLFISTLKSAVSMQPKDLLMEEVTPEILKGEDEEENPTEPFNDRIAIIGYDNMEPIDEVEEIRILFLTQVAGVALMFIGYFCHSLLATAIMERMKINLKEFFIWGNIINLILASYLPLTTAMFISVVGLDWDDEKGAINILNNLWSIVMLHVWLATPVVIMIMLYRGREDIGKLRPDAKVKKDRMKADWKDHWVRAKQQREKDKENPEDCMSKVRSIFFCKRKEPD